MIGIGHFAINWILWYIPAQARYCLKNKWLNKLFGTLLHKISTFASENSATGNSSVSSCSMSSGDEAPNRFAGLRTPTTYLPEKQIKGLKDSIYTSTNKTEAVLIQDSVQSETNRQLCKSIGEDGTLIALNKKRQRSLIHPNLWLTGGSSRSKKLSYKSTLSKIQEVLELANKNDIQIDNK